MAAVGGTEIVLFFCFILFSVVSLVAWDLYKKRHIFNFARGLNGHNFYPFIGSAYHFIGKNVFTGVQEVVKKYGLPCNIWVGHDYHYMTANMSEIKIILNDPGTFGKSSMYETFRMGFGNTLLMAEVENWKRNRKIFAKSFSRQTLNSFVKTFFEKSSILVDVLRNSHSNEIFEIFDRFSLDNFCASVVRLDLDAQRNIVDEISYIIPRLQDILGKRILSSFFLPESLWLFTPAGRTGLKYYNRLKEVIYEIIQKKRKAFLENKGCSDFDKLTLMDMMLEAEGVTFTDEEIFQEIFLFMLAGTDTSGTSLGFIFTLLGMNPEVQEAIYQEVIQNVGTDGPIHHSDLANLKYVERAILEAMRLLPVTPLLGRRVTADVDLGTRTIPTGSNILISVFNLHRSEEHWTNPLEYNPDRFLPEEVEKRDPYAFIPFSGGPRNCIGKHHKATYTSGTTLAFTFMLLGMNLEAQDKVFHEVIQNVGTDGLIHHSDLPNLKYTERAIFESMRLLPVALVLGRHATADVDLGIRKIPAGADILISVFNLHRSEKHWTNPLEYNPDRFLPEEVAKRHPYAFVPFSAGPRNCLGMKYAMMMMKTAVAHVIRNYKVRSGYKSVEDMQLESCITMKTVHPLDCKFIPR